MPRLNKFLSETAIFAVPGALATVAGHPLEHGLYGRSGMPKTTTRLVYNKAGRPIGRTRIKNPARYTKLTIPFKRKPIEMDRGNWKQHLIARLPKGILAGGITLGAASILKSKLRLK